MTFATGYAYSAVLASAVYRNEEGKVPPDMFIPVIGPYVALGRGIKPETLIVGRVFGNSSPCSGHDFCLAAWGEIYLFVFEYGVLVFDPVVQATGLTVTAVGAATKSHEKTSTALAPTRPHVSFAPTWQSGPGISLVVSSW